MVAGATICKPTMGLLPVLDGAVVRQPQAVQAVDHLRHELSAVLVEKLRVSHLYMMAVAGV